MNLEEIFPKKLEDKSSFYLDCEYLNNLPQGYLKNFKKRLSEHCDYEKIKDNYIIDEQKNTLVYILEKIPTSEVEDLTNEERMYYPLCNKKEIKRIINIKTAEDYLLKYRADQIVDNIRLHRVFSTIRKKTKNWNFTNYFNTDVFNHYLDILPIQEKEKCKSVICGTIYLKEANGFCMKTEQGDVIVISFALQNFLYYMNLFHFGSQLDIKNKDTVSSFKIALRIVLGTEALDFEIDSRGNIPLKADKEIKAATYWQMLFVVGHEFAHHYLGHLNGAATIHLKSMDSESENDTVFYNYSQKKELNADYYAVMTPNVSDKIRNELADSAFLFFFWLDLYDFVKNYLFPPKSSSSSHPKPIDRIWELRKRLDKKYGLSTEELNSQVKYYDNFKDMLLKEYLPYNVDELEIYGSHYLPSFKKKLEDDRLFF